MFFSEWENAIFGISQRGRKILLHDGYTFVKDGDNHGTTNWRCSCFQSTKCRARAVTREYFNGGAKVKLTKIDHNHVLKTKSKMYKFAIEKLY